MSLSYHFVARVPVTESHANIIRTYNTLLNLGVLSIPEELIVALRNMGVDKGLITDHEHLMVEKTFLEIDLDKRGDVMTAEGVCIKVSSIPKDAEQIRIYAEA